MPLDGVFLILPVPSHTFKVIINHRIFTFYAVISFITAFLLVKFNPKRKSGVVASFLLLLAPLVIFLNMWGHTVSVLIVNYKRYVGGVFQYNFNFYALILFGVVFALLSGINIDRARKLINGDASQKRTLHWLNAITAVLFLPMVFLNPIASLPVIASIISSTTLIALQSKQKAKATNAQFEPISAR